MVYKHDRKQGFTLLELLVVIAIIGLLAAIATVSINSSRTKARNARRNQDVRQLMTAFALVTDSLGGTPPSAALWTCVSSNCYGGWNIYAADPAIDALLEPYIKKPQDPAESSRGFGGYLYTYPVGDLAGLGPGAYFLWILEPVSIVAGVCGPGIVYQTDANYIACLGKVPY